MRDASSQLFERIFSPNSLSCFRSITDKSLIGLSIPSDSLDTMYVQWYDEMFKSTALNRCSIIGTIDSAYRKRAYLPEW